MITVNVSCPSINVNIESPIAAIQPNPYTGETTITPTTETQTLQTANKSVLTDIVIEPIPNNYGLITWDGSRLMIS